MTQRIAGIDYGTVRIGVAIGDMEVRMASPYENYNRRNEQLDGQYFKQLAVEEGIELFVVGLPVHLNGNESQKSIEARDFGTWLKQLTDVPVEFFDERFTSVEAEQILSAANLTKKQRKARLDQLAAQIMLTAYMESSGRSGDKTANDEPGSLD